MYTQISDKALLAVTQNKKVKAQVFADLKDRFKLKTNDTARNYFRDRHYILTTIDAIRIISSATGLTMEEILCEVEIIYSNH